jgi:hypothetical protein
MDLKDILNRKNSRVCESGDVVEDVTVSEVQGFRMDILLTLLPDPFSNRDIEVIAPGESVSGADFVRAGLAVRSGVPVKSNGEKK